MVYGVCTMAVPPGTVNDALSGFERGLAAGRIQGQLRGCWYADFGRLNRILAVTAYPSADALAADHEAMLRSADPFGVAAIATAIELDAYASFPGVEFLPPGRVGPVFEVRTYRLKRAGLAPTIASWQKVRAARAQLSPIVAVMYALSGVVPRILHIWPYPTLERRAAIREAAVAKGIWPPPASLEHIETTQSEIFLPAPFSPLQ